MPTGLNLRCRLFFGSFTSVLLGVASCCAAGAPQARAADAAPAALSFDPAQVRKGAELAAIGNCAACHAAQHGKPLAGGRPLNTPFGAIHSTNITPDPESGIGNWSRADFLRAMHEGVDRRGRNLYPAFPYDHFTLATDQDVDAIYAFLMTRDPVHAQVPRNTLVFPVNIRATVSVWKALYFRDGVFQPVPSQSAQWNRGAYLAEGLAHCGACHTPHNALGAEKKALAYDGGDEDGWHAPALNRASPAASAWTVERLVAYLRGGIDDVHDAAGGPMAGVVHNLSQVAEEDVRAIAVYFASMGAGQAPRRGGADADANPQAYARGAATYAGACASCHDLGRQTPGGALDLSLSTIVALPAPGNLIRVVRTGVIPRDGEKGPWMPAFGGAFGEQQLADLAVYLRAHFAQKPAWSDVPGAVRKVVRNESKK